MLPCHLDEDMRFWQSQVAIVLETSDLAFDLSHKGKSKRQPCRSPRGNCVSQVEGPLSQHFAESVAAGRYHVAALAGPINAATGKAYEGLESTVVFMWGRGMEGQLGNGSYSNSAVPQLVEDLRDRRISQVRTLS